MKPVYPRARRRRRSTLRRVQCRGWLRCTGGGGNCRRRGGSSCERRASSGAASAELGSACQRLRIKPYCTLTDQPACKQHSATPRECVCSFLACSFFFLFINSVLFFHVLNATERCATNAAEGGARCADLEKAYILRRKICCYERRRQPFLEDKTRLRVLFNCTRLWIDERRCARAAPFT